MTLLLVALTPWAEAQVPIRYQVVFESTWSFSTHPLQFPGNPHFSPPIGVVHNGEVSLWSEGGIATQGIESMAETGGTGALTSEIQAASGAGNASPARILSGQFISPGSTSTTFLTADVFPYVTLVSMLAPSPDWFVGVDTLELLANGHWRDDVVAELYPWDAGTDSGVSYNSGNADTQPQEPIALIDAPPLEVDGYLASVGTFTFTIVDVDGLPPYADQDNDGLSNLREAELGSDAALPDTDTDSVGDATDNCPTVADATQVDTDLDAHGDVCDNCPALANGDQSDHDDDGEGNRCDLDDGRLWFTALDGVSVRWQDDTAFTEFNLYRGSLDVLLSSGQYTQDPAGTAAFQRCGLSSPLSDDSETPAAGAVWIYLVTGSDGTTESPLGEDRSNHHPCGA